MLKPLQTLKDHELLTSTKMLAQKERAVTLEVLHHLREIERRKLYSDLQYGSLFEYAVGELRYSEAAAGRRIQAMRLMADIPEIAPKLESGALNLSSLCQAQGFFRDFKKAQPTRPLNVEAKKEVLAQLEHKSAREGQRILLGLGGPQVLPRERERLVSPEHTEVRFVMNQELQAQLTAVRALLGPRGGSLNFAELVLEMARLSVERLAEKKFGKKRAQQAAVSATQPQTVQSQVQMPAQARVQTQTQSQVEAQSQPLGSSVGVNRSPRRSRYIPAALKHQVWQQAGGRCASCGSQHNLQFDHIQPFALGGESSAENLQLSCGSCNLRRGVKAFGVASMRRA